MEIKKSEQIIYETDSQNNLYIMRGLPGSGKSTVAKSYGGIVFASDDFFMKDGIYQFDFSKLEEARDWNRNRAKIALERGVPKIIADNTNTRAWEIKPYAILGIKNNYNIILVEPDTPHKWDVEKLAILNSHSVPIEAIQKMKERYEHNLTLDQILKSKSPDEI